MYISKNKNSTWTFGKAVGLYMFMLSQLLYDDRSTAALQELKFFSISFQSSGYMTLIMFYSFSRALCFLEADGKRYIQCVKLCSLLQCVPGKHCLKQHFIATRIQKRYPQHRKINCLLFLSDSICVLLYIQYMCLLKCKETLKASLLFCPNPRLCDPTLHAQTSICRGQQQIVKYAMGLGGLISEF